MPFVALGAYVAVQESQDHFEDGVQTTFRHVRPGESLPPRPPPCPASVLRILQSSNDNWPYDPEPGPASELDCLRPVFAQALLRAAATRSQDVETGADQVLIRSGVIGEDAYLQALSAHTDLALETFDTVSRAECSLSDRHLLRAAEHGLLPLRCDGQLIWAIAPRGFAARRLSRFAAAYPSLRSRVRLISMEALSQFLLRQTGGTIGRAAAHALGERFPSLSAAPAVISSRSRWRRLACAGALATLMTMMPIFAPEFSGNLLAGWFLAFIGLRFAGSLVSPRRVAKPPRIPDNRLPVYTVIAALYHEAASVGPLIEAINALDYPREKLDVLIVIELDDLGTRAALAKVGPMPHVRILLAPAEGPRTKPKALNCALPFARGSFTAVFDAEDRPDPGQLRAALDAVRTEGADVACAQASLCIENLGDSWLSCMFAAEYAGQFDVFLPGFARFGLPLPLGGSSNHFRTAVLREVGGWDAYNVTEDADLGFRLARFGYRSVTFASTTYEEAPARFGGWLRQRSRWMKGWIQTWNVHMRRPVRLWRDAGAKGFLTLNILVGGNVLTALTFPVLVATIAIDLLAHLGMTRWFAANSVTPLHLTTIIAGFASTIAIGLTGLARRGQLRHGWILLLTPLYWGCLSIAAWRALIQLLSNPYRWEKTEHGLSRRVHTNGGLRPSKFAASAVSINRRRSYR